MATLSGKNYLPSHPTHDLININDISHALSNICRFAGHVSSFYSVAQHSVLVARIIEGLGGNPYMQLHGILHDATEAYLTDIPTPVKRLITGFDTLEDNFYRVIAEVYGLEPELPEIVKRADGIALATEARDLMGDPKNWRLPHEPCGIIVIPKPPIDAKTMFLEAFHEIYSKI